MVVESWADGFHELSYAIHFLRNYFLWFRISVVWKTSAIRRILCGPLHMDLPGHLQQYLVALLSLWSIRMVMENAYLCAPAANEKISCLCRDGRRGRNN